MFLTENTALLMVAFSSFFWRAKKLSHVEVSGLNLKRSNELLKTVTELIAIAPAARNGRTL